LIESSLPHHGCGDLSKKRRAGRCGISGKRRGGRPPAPIRQVSVLWAKAGTHFPEAEQVSAGRTVSRGA
jgi:hypothetical protein